MGLLGPSLWSPTVTGDQSPRDQSAPAAVEFTTRVARYVETRRRLQGTLPPLDPQADATTVALHRRALARLIQQARREATAGEVFSEPVRRWVRQTLARARAEIGWRPDLHDEQDAPIRFRPRVNAIYPEAIPVAAVPPAVLAALPELPPGLAYRFLGPDLVLLDTDANLIVDFVRRAVP